MAKCRDAKICSTTIDEMLAEMSPISAALQDSQDYLIGSEQERAALDKAYTSQTKLANMLTTLQEQMVPANYATAVPSNYDDLAQLQGRATVEMVIRKPDKSPFDIMGQNFAEAKMTMVIDGYTGMYW